MHWDLSDIIRNNDYVVLKSNFESLLTDFRVKSSKMMTKFGTSAEFNEIVQITEKLAIIISRFYSFASLNEEIDQSNSEYKFLKSKAKKLINQYDDAVRNFFLWTKGKTLDGYNVLDDKSANKLFKDLKQLKYSFERSRKLEIHSLTAQEEMIMSRKDINLVTQIKDLRSLIDAEQVYTIKSKNDNKVKTYTNSSYLLKNVFSKSAKVRKASYISLFSSYKKNLIKYFQIYEALSQDWDNEATLRKYASPISMRNEANDINDDDVQTMMRAVIDNKTIFRDFFKLKAKLLGVPKLSRFDLYAPLKKSPQLNYKYEDAVDLVLRVFKSFDYEFYNFALNIINGNHIDPLPAKNKSSGAFCSTVSPQIKPYVMLNFTGSWRDILVLAHELGHGIHSQLAEKQPHSTQQANLALAETGSTLAEMIVFDYLYKIQSDNNIKEEMLSSKIMDSYATICRQTYFSKFEIDAHNAISKGININSFNELYFANIKELFGNSINVDRIFKYEWAYIPHIFDEPFYCYAYSFGNLLSLSIYKDICENKKANLPKIKDILSSGSSENTKILLKRNGYDISDKELWNKGFEIIKDWIKYLQV